MKTALQAVRRGLLAAAVAVAAPSAYALDSYRYLHVTIDTPWTIFLFLLVAVLSPFILMAILVWRFAERRVADREAEVSAAPADSRKP